MTTDYHLQAPTRVCAVSGRELRAGERVYAALLDEGEKFVRRDYAAEAWAGPPTGVIAYWVGRVPATAAPRKPTVNEGLLVDWFHHLADTPDPHRANVRYVVALLLMRRKRLKFEDLRRSPDGAATLVVRDAKGGGRHEVPDPRLTEAEIDAVQADVFRVLGWE